MLSAHPQSWALRAIRARCKWSLLLCWRDRCTAPGSGHCRPFGSGIGHTARPLPVAVADSPIEAATPDPQHPMCYLWWPHHSEYPWQASCRTVPSAWADGQIPASGASHVRCPLPSPIRPSKRPLPIHSTQCGFINASRLYYHRDSSTPGQLPDRPVGLGRRAVTGIGPTARPRPIAVADSPIEAATPDPQHPLCLITGARRRPAPVMALYHCRSS